MATPDYKTLLRGATTWREKHGGVQISLNHHAYRDGTEYEGCSPEPGIWCYYLHLTEEMFRPEDWARLLMPERVHDWGVSHDTDAFPDLDFHGGITFYEVRGGWSKKKKAKVGNIKVGCDYAHSWDRDSGYYQNYDDVLKDAQHSVDKLLRQFPDRMACCDYSGVWGEPAEFYEAVNGRTVHRSYADTFDDGWKAWRPKESTAPLIAEERGTK